MDSGRTFEADPNVNVKVEVVQNLVEPGKDEAVTADEEDGDEFSDIPF
jgi:hypothetical protein